MNTNLKIALTLVVCSPLAAPVAAQTTIKGFGSTIKVGPDKGAGSDVDVDLPGINVRTRAAETPQPPEGGQVIDVPAAATVTKQYRIGLAGGDVSPELRMHLGLEGVGVMVREVTPDSPAEKAGIEKFDILLAADAAPLATIQDLVATVRVSGPKQQPIAIELLRRGKSLTVSVTPEEQEVAAPPQLVPRIDKNWLDLGDGAAGQPFQFRMFGPGLAMGQGGAFGGNAQLFANGVSVVVQSQNGRSIVTAKKGDQKWEFDADDQEAIAQLPPDVRQHVEQLTAGGGGVEIDLNQFAPLMQGLFERRGDRRADGRRGLFEAFEERFRRMQQGVPEPDVRPLEAAPADAGEAPIFEPGDALDPTPPAQPVEIEVPAEAGAE